MPAGGGTEEKSTTEHGKADTAVKVSAGKDAIAVGTEAGAAKPDQLQGSETADQTPDIETAPEAIPETSTDTESKTDAETSAPPAAKETSEPTPTDASEPTDADEPSVDIPAEPHQKSPAEAEPPDVDDHNEKVKDHAKAKENLSLVWTFISTFIVTCIVIIAVALVAVKVSGCYLFTVQTGSMTPTYPVNTVVLVKPYDSFEEVQVGDVVTYLLDESGTTVTHRVVSIDTVNEKLTTQGDANDSPDAAQVLYGNVIGKVVVGIPNIGKIVKVVAAEENRTTVIAVIVIILAALILSDLIKSIRRKRRNKKQQKE